jgi:pantoate kinase
MKAIAFAPAHISGFFQPIYHDNIYKTGSRGAGVNLSQGCIATVDLNEASAQQVDIFINSKKRHSSVISTAISQLINKKKVHLVVDLKTELPVSQGFGMSAASTLSTTLAIAKLIQLSRKDALMAAHYAEVTSKTGLGDVAAADTGGIEIREKPGIKPWGKIHQIQQSGNVVICVIDSIISTKTILQDESYKKIIQTVGADCTDKLLLQPSVEHFFQLSKKFTIETNLAKEKILAAIQAVELYGMASMCMLGNSVFAIGKIEKIYDILSDFGTVKICNIDKNGARIIS